MHAIAKRPPTVTPADVQEALADLGVFALIQAKNRARSLTNDEAQEQFRFTLLGSERSAHTIRMYLYFVRRMLSSVGKPVAEVSLYDLERFRAGMREGGASPQTIHLVTHAIRAFFDSLGLATARSLKPPKRPATLPSYLKEPEVSALLEAAATDARASAIVHVLAYAGIRLGELVHLERSDVDLEEGTLRIRSGKGARDRYVVLDPAAVESVRRYIGQSDCSPLFAASSSSVERLIRKLGREAHLGDGVHPHMLRHALGTALLKRGCDLRFIQSQLGHASVGTTQLYAHVDVGSLRAAYAKARPGFGSPPPVSPPSPDR